MPRGGRRSTTWTSAWKSGETKRVRIPIAIADRVIEIAHLIDEGSLDPDSLVPRQTKGSIALSRRKLNKIDKITNESLTLKSNAGGKIKNKVREVRKILQLD